MEHYNNIPQMPVHACVRYVMLRNSGVALPHSRGAWESVAGMAGAAAALRLVRCTPISSLPMFSLGTVKARRQLPYRATPLISAGLQV